MQKSYIVDTSKSVQNSDGLIYRQPANNVFNSLQRMHQC
jgi:hypothetical protein